MQSGTLNAASANDAVLLLSRQGLNLQSLNAVAAPVGRGVQQIILDSQSPTSHSSVAGTVPHANPPKPQSRLTGFFKDHDQWMLMAQFGTLLRSGYNPHDMLRELAQRQSLKRKVREALQDMSIWTGHGLPLSDAMAAFPEIFPPGAVGSVRAGEHGGYLAEACLHTSEQIQQSWRLRRTFAWTVLAIWSTLLMIPFIPIMKRGSDALATSIDGGPDQNFLDIYLHGIGSAFLGVGGVMLVLFLAVWLLGPYITGRRTFLRFRHGLAAHLPLIRHRTRLESARELSFHLERLSEAGNSPLRSFQLAAEAIPNVVHRDLLAAAARNRPENVPYAALIPPNWISPNYMNLIQTGEMTGTTPQAFEQVRRLSESEQKNYEGFLKVKAWVWVILFSFGAGAVVFAVMYRQFYDSMFKAILGDW